MSFRSVFSLCSLLLSGCGAELSSATDVSTRAQALTQEQPSNVHGVESALPASEQTVGSGSGHQVVGSIDGFFSHIQPGLVRGSVLMELDAAGDVQLALQLHDGTAWVDHSVRDLRLTQSVYGEVEATLSPNQPVRFEIRVRRQPLGEQHLRLSFTRLFGAECVPDFANPGTCL